ncbi:MAG: hypothetical protein RJA61_585 [Candidatus Parcubacteria bacterium]|jgi:hypothetical protein
MFTLFTISGILLVSFTLSRLIELKLGKRTFVGRLTCATDVFFVGLVEKTKHVYRMLISRIGRLFSHHVPAHSERVWDSVRRFAQAKQVKARDIIRGRKDFSKSNPSVSFFLKNISDARRKNAEGRTILG